MKAAAAFCVTTAAFLLVLFFLDSVGSPPSRPSPGHASVAAASKTTNPAESGDSSGGLFSDPTAVVPTPATRSEVPREELAALDRLIATGEAGIPSLQRAMEDVRTTEAEKLRAARALAAIGTHEALQALFDGIFAQSDAATRRFLVSALDGFGDVETVDSLVSLLTQPADPDIYTAVIDTVSRMAQASTVEYLSRLSTAPSASSDTPSPVLRALGSIRNEEAIPALGNILSRRDASPEVRAAAATSLAKMGTKRSLMLLARAGEGAALPDEQSLQALASVQDPAAVQHLKALLETSGNTDVAVAIARSLQNIESLQTPVP